VTEPGDQQPVVAGPALVLASASPRRRALLGVLRGPDRIDPADIDEAVGGGEAPGDYVSRVAFEKAARVAGSHPDAWILGADTAVVADARILGKPGDAARARTMLRMLSARMHEVYSALVLLGPDGARACRTCISRVWFDALPEAWIERYVDSGEPLDKAGGYAVQGAAAAWIPRIEGSYSGIVGLPLYETAVLLRQAGLIDNPPENPRAPHGERAHE